jgi:hypothetical protein
LGHLSESKVKKSRCNLTLQGEVITELSAYYKGRRMVVRAFS